MRAVLSFILFVFIWNIYAKSPEPVKYELKDSLSYAIGMDIGGSLKDIDVDMPTFYKGLEDAMKERPLLLTPEQAKEVKKSSFARLDLQLGEKARKAGEAFLEQNKKNKNVIVTQSGLQYIVERPGSGPKPRLSDKVSVNYKGTLVDGKEFDNSYARGEPLTIGVGNVIPGWSEALQLMNAGSKYKLFIPAGLAYGDRRAGAKIPPNSALLFDVELLEIVRDSAATAAPAPSTGARKPGK